MWSSNLISRYIAKGNENRISKGICTPIFIAALFIVAKTWKQSVCLYIDIYTTHTHTLFSQDKEGNSAIFDNLDWRWGHYKWNKPDREKQILHEWDSLVASSTQWT